MTCHYGFEAKLLRQLLDRTSSPTAIAQATTGRFLYANSAFASRLGYDPDKLIALAIADLAPDWPATGLERASLGEPLPPFTTRLRRQDDHWLETEVSLILIETGPDACVGIQLNDVEALPAGRQEPAESERRWRLLAETTSDLVYQLTLSVPLPISLPVADQVDWIFAKAEISAVNESFAKAQGLARDELAGMPVTKIIPRTTHNELIFRTVVERGHRAIDERTEEIDRYGRRKVVLSSIIGRIADGYVLDYIGTARDITDHVLAEESLKSRERHLDLALSASGAISYEWDIVNDRVQRVSVEPVYSTGTDTEGLGGVLRGVHPDDRDSFRAAVDHALKSGLYENEHRIVRPGGEIRWLAERGRVDYDTHGRPIRLSGISLDVTMRKQQEQHHREIENRLHRAIRSARALVYETDGRHNVTVTDNAAQVLGEEPPQEQSSDWWRDRIHPEDRDRADAAHGRQHTEGGHLSVKYRVRHADGRWLWVQDDSEVFLDTEGRAERRVGTLVDIDRLKRAQDEAEEQRRLIDALIAGTTDLIWTKDRAGRITFGNKATYDLLGAGRPEHVLGRDAHDLVSDPAQAQKIIDNDNLVLGSERPILVEESFGHGDSLIVFQSHKAPLRNGEGKTIGVLGISRDVTQAHRLEERLRQSEVRFRSTFDNAAVGMGHLSLDGRWLAVNDKLCDITGYAREELLTRRWQDLTEPDSIGFEKSREQQLASGAITSFTVEKRYRRKDGTPIWVAVTVSMARNEAGDPDFIISVVRDISDEKRAIVAVRQSEALFRLIADNAPAMVWLTDPYGRGTYISQAWYDLTGLPPGTAAGPGWLDPIHPDDRPIVAAADAAQRAARGELHLEYRLRDRHGAWRWVIDMAVPLVDDAGNFQGWVGSIVDITQRKQAESELMDSRNHQTFILSLSDRLRPLSDPIEIQLEAARALGDHLGASVGYAEDEGDGETVSIHRDYGRGGPSLAGTHRYRDYGAELLQRLRNGETVVRPDIANDPTLSKEEKLAHAKFSLASTVNVPLIKSGELVALLYVCQDVPRNWLPSEIDLIRDTAERIWASVAQARAEAQSRRTLRLLESIMEAAPVSIYLYDVKTGHSDLVSPRARRMLGYDEAAWAQLMKNPTQLLHPEDALSVGVHMESLASAGTEGRKFEYRMRHADGSWRWFLSSDVVFDRTEDGGVHRVLGTATDITEKQKHEERLRFLMREVNHRSKNLLSVVQAIARSTSATNSSDFLERFGERLQSLSASQDLIVRNAWRSVPLDELVRVQLAHLGDIVDRRIDISGPAIAVSAAASQTIGMALHELATNAMKHGSLRGATGRVRLHWTCEGAAEDPECVLSWIEESDEPLPPPIRKGFGTRVIESMVRRGLEAEVSLEYHPQGFRWEVRCPLRNLTEYPAETSAES